LVFFIRSTTLYTTGQHGFNQQYRHIWQERTRGAHLFEHQMTCGERNKRHSQLQATNMHYIYSVGQKTHTGFEACWKRHTSPFQATCRAGSPDSLTCQCPALLVLRYPVLKGLALALGSGRGRSLCKGLLCPAKQNTLCHRQYLQTWHQK